jgi:hypothetical protein
VCLKLSNSQLNNEALTTPIARASIQPKGGKTMLTNPKSNPKKYNFSTENRYPNLVEKLIILRCQ